MVPQLPQYQPQHQAVPELLMLAGPEPATAQPPTADAGWDLSTMGNNLVVGFGLVAAKYYAARMQPAYVPL